MNYSDGDFVKVIKDDSKESSGLLMKCDEKDKYKILILRESLIKDKLNEECEAIFCEYSDGRLIDSAGLKIIVEKINDKFLIEELRQAYNLYVEQ